MAHLLLALPTFRASHEMTAETRETHLLSLSFGVNVATREATAMTLAAICNKLSTFSVMYSIIVWELHEVGGVAAISGKKDCGLGCAPVRI